jgi:hypothetical protein
MHRAHQGVRAEFAITWVEQELYPSFILLASISYLWVIKVQNLRDRYLYARAVAAVSKVQQRY